MSEPKLVESEEGLVFTDGTVSIRGDFVKMLPRIRQSNLQRELLVKAARSKGGEDPLLAVDATAGLGEDSLLLAAAGFQVRMYECNPVIAALLRDAMERGRQVAELSPVLGRMELLEEDSVNALPALDFKPHVVLLDPMFPARQKSAAVKKKFQLLHLLEAPCREEKALLAAAFAAEPKKILIKRPPKGPWLAGMKPDHSLMGKAVRFDCILPGSRKIRMEMQSL